MDYDKLSPRNKRFLFKRLLADDSLKKYGWHSRIHRIDSDGSGSTPKNRNLRIKEEKFIKEEKKIIKEENKIVKEEKTIIKEEKKIVKEEKKIIKEEKKIVKEENKIIKEEKIVKEKKKIIKKKIVKEEKKIIKRYKLPPKEKMILRPKAEISIAENLHCKICHGHGSDSTRATDPEIKSECILPSAKMILRKRPAKVPPAISQANKRREENAVSSTGQDQGATEEFQPSPFFLLGLGEYAAFHPNPQEMSNDEMKWTFGMPRPTGAVDYTDKFFPLKKIYSKLPEEKFKKLQMHFQLLSKRK